MRRLLAGSAATLLLVTGTSLLWQGRAESPSMPAAPTPRLASAMAPINLARIPSAPSADPKNKEEKRFARADKDEDGRITLAELVEPRRKAFAKLDLNQDGSLSFEEWAVKTIDKFTDADDDQSKALTPIEYAATAPKRKPPKAACSCGYERWSPDKETAAEAKLPRPQLFRQLKRWRGLLRSSCRAGLLPARTKRAGPG